MKDSLEAIQEFLGSKRIAMVGISRNPADFSAKLFEEFCRHGYDMVPVNPTTAEIHARKCFPRLQEVEPRPDGALLMTPPAVTDSVVHDCLEAGIRRVWMYRAGGKGAVSPRAVQFCREHGITIIAGQCPFMFLPEVAGVHRFHGFLRKITGRYPRHTTA